MSAAGQELGTEGAELPLLTPAPALVDTD